MAIETDPAEKPEELDSTTTDPQVEEEAAESGAESSEGAETETETELESDKVATKTVEHDIVVAGEEPAAAKVDTAEKAKARNREYARLRARTAELERKLAEKEQATAAVADPGPRPKLEDSDFDQAKHDQAVDEWHEKKRLKATADAQAAQEAQRLQGERQQKQIKYGQDRLVMMEKLPDYEELEKTVAEGLSQVQRDVILHYADDPTKVVAALGRSPERLQDFADTKDLGLLIAKAAKLEVRTELKSKTTTPPPEKRITGSGSKVGAVDAHEERLRKKADASGDRTELNRYLREKRRK